MGRVPSGTQVTVLGVGEKNLHVISGTTAGFVPASYATPRLYYNDSQEKRAAAGRIQAQTSALSGRSFDDAKQATSTNHYHKNNNHTEHLQRGAACVMSI